MFKVSGTPALTKVVLAIIFALSLIYLIAVAYHVSSLQKSIEQKQGELEAYQSDGLAKLNREKIRLERQLNAIDGSYSSISGLIASKAKSRMPKDPGDSLKFKEELYKVQNMLKEDGKAINFEFPFWLGFEKYEHDIPNAADLPLRVKQLEIIKEMGNLMLKTGIPSLTAVEFEDVKDVRLEGGKDIIYKEFPVKVGFICKNENLINFLYGLTVSDIPFNADYIKLKSSEPGSKAKGDLSVELVVTAAIFP